MKLETGKTYLSQRGYKYYIVGFSRNGQLAIAEDDEHNIGQRFYKDGKCIHQKDSDLVKEYKEPAVHRRDVIWYTDKYTRKVCEYTTMPGTQLPDHLIELKRQTVEYIEE